MVIIYVHLISPALPVTRQTNAAIKFTITIYHAVFLIASEFKNKNFICIFFLFCVMLVLEFLNHEGWWLS